jgi:hypothetical protein
VRKRKSPVYAVLFNLASKPKNVSSIINQKDYSAAPEIARGLQHL